jgi:hypothetical protein
MLFVYEMHVWLPVCSGLQKLYACVCTFFDLLCCHSSSPCCCFGTTPHPTNTNTATSTQAASLIWAALCASLQAGWEGAFVGQIAAIRRREAAFIRRTARIKAFNMGLSASIIPLVSLF